MIGSKCTGSRDNVVGVVRIWGSFPANGKKLFFSKCSDRISNTFSSVSTRQFLSTSPPTPLARLPTFITPSLLSVYFSPIADTYPTLKTDKLLRHFCACPPDYVVSQTRGITVQECV